MQEARLLVAEPRPALPPGAQEPWAPGTCSNSSQNPYDFAKIAAQYAE